MTGWFVAMAAQPTARKTKRQGTRWAVTKRRREAKNRPMKRVLLRASFEKFVGGSRLANMESWALLKSSILFWRSRILRKKSFDRSGAGLILGAGAIGGPPKGYSSDGNCAGGGGWRARNAGTIMKKRQSARGTTTTR